MLREIAQECMDLSQLISWCGVPKESIDKVLAGALRSNEVKADVVRYARKFKEEEEARRILSSQSRQ